MVDDIDIIKNCEPILKNKIVLYGAGFYGKKAATMLRKLGIPVEAVCTTTRAEKSLIKGVRHISVSELKEMDDRENLLIVIATIVGEFMDQIVMTLDQCQINRGRRITYLGLSYACVLNRKVDRSGELVCERELWHMGHEDFIRGGAYHQLWQGFSENAVWVYTPGKVGSTTLCNSFDRCGIANAHIHTMQKERMRYGSLWYLDGRAAIPGRYFNGYNTFLRYLREGHVKIITAVREPIARSISKFFQGFMVPYSQWMDQTNDIYDDFVKMTEGFAKNDDEFKWFDQELKAVLGIDIYAYPFDKERGYAIIDKDNVSVFVLKLESLDTLVPVIGEFVQAENFEIINANENKDKAYRYMYEEFKQNFRLPKRYVDSYYKSNLYMDHFYSAKEKEAFLEKWRKHIW